MGAVKVQMFKRANLTTDATHSGSVSNNGFNASQYMVGQILKDTFLDLGPTFVKGLVIMFDCFKSWQCSLATDYS
jgi:hypothetical protein